MKEAFEKNITLCYCLISAVKIVHSHAVQKKHPGKASSKSDKSSNKDISSGAKPLGVKFQLRHFLAVRLCKAHLKSLWFCFFSYSKKVTKNIWPHRAVMRIKILNVYMQDLEPQLTHYKHCFNIGYHGCLD